ncbi:MAG: UDP-N-acetylmuramate--L-alanine ligase, partial [Peptococcaceae bacterium]|nr:UDP-N-acetylmuramate--L-alanine ligase [Peptococcaceae bacterium]
FDAADEVVLTDVYAAGEDLSEGAESDIIAQHMQRPAHLVAREQLNKFLQGFVKPGDMVLMMGAGNIWQNSIQLVEDLKQL